jgi:predicted enzyme related to lactoylglutathione lyase
MALMKLVGVELYFEDLERAKAFYESELGLALSGEEEGHHAQFGASPFLCCEKAGVETYPSRDKAVLFFEVPDLRDAITRIGRGRFVRIETKWAVLHDPEGHNVMLLEA